MKRLFLVVMLVLFVAQIAVAQGLSYEGSFKGIFVKDKITLSGERGITLQELGLADKTTLKEFSILVSLSRDLRLKYTYMLPTKETGTGTLFQSINFGGVAYGPKEGEKAGQAEGKVITVQYGVSSQRFEFNFLPIVTQVGQTYPVILTEYLMPSVTLKGKPAGSTGNDEIEASASVNKFTLGAGIGGFQRQGRLVTNYTAVYTFLNTGKGWFVDVNLCYLVDERGFVAVGYRLHTFDSPLVGDIRLKNEFSGLLAEVGLSF
jgi:hypothetical protein